MLARYLEGEQLAEICAEYGLGTTSAYALLYRVDEQGFSQAQASRALARHSEALRELDTVKTALLEAKGEGAELEIKRQRELLRLSEIRLKSSHFELERLLKRLYGVEPVMQLNVLNIGDVDSKIQALERELGVAATRSIESETALAPVPAITLPR